MTGSDFRAIREKLALTQGQLAETIGIKGSRAAAGIQDWEQGRREIPAPVALLMQALLTFGTPDRWPGIPKQPAPVGPEAAHQNVG